MSARFRRPGTMVAVAAAAFIPLAGHAQSWTRQGDEVLKLNIGALASKLDTKVRLDGSAGGSEVDLEGEAGLKDRTSTFSLDGSWRIASRHRIDAFYSNNKRSGSTTTQRDYEIGDEFIPAGTRLSAEQKLALFYAGYRYSFLKTPDMEMAVGAGLYGGNIKFKFDAQQPVVNIDEGTTLPLPVLVLTGDWYLTDRLLLSAGIRGLKVKIGDVDGSVFQASIVGEYLLTNNFGVGVAFDHFDVDVGVTKSDFRGNANLKTDSGRLYLTMRF